MLVSYSFYGLFSAILKMNTIKKNTGTNEVVFTERKQTWRCDGNHKTQFLSQREILYLSLRSIKVNNWSADNFEKTRHVNELYT